MVSANDHKHYCAVCGAELPLMKHNEYLEKHCAIRLPTGQQLYYCPGTRHSAQEIDEAIHGLPAFTTGSILKKKQNLI
jgi:hypothetical protein